MNSTMTRGVNSSKYLATYYHQYYNINANH